MYPVMIYVHRIDSDTVLNRPVETSNESIVFAPLRVKQKEWRYEGSSCLHTELSREWPVLDSLCFWTTLFLGPYLDEASGIFASSASKLPRFSSAFCSCILHPLQTYIGS